MHMIHTVEKYQSVCILSIARLRLFIWSFFIVHVMCALKIPQIVFLFIIVCKKKLYYDLVMKEFLSIIIFSGRIFEWIFIEKSSMQKNELIKGLKKHTRTNGICFIKLDRRHRLTPNSLMAIFRCSLTNIALCMNIIIEIGSQITQHVTSE